MTEQVGADNRSTLSTVGAFVSFPYILVGAIPGAQPDVWRELFR